MKLNKLFFGFITVFLLSCAEEDPFAAIDAEVERLEKENPTIEKVKIDQTPINISWNKFKSGMLQSGRIVILEGYLKPLPKDMMSFGNSNETNFSFSERRNQAYSYAAQVKLPIGTIENEMYQVPELYDQTDLKIVTNNGEIATVSSHVQVVGTYNGFNIKLKEINIIEPQFDEFMLSRAIELTDENIIDSKKDSCYAFMDVQFDLDKELTTMDAMHYWVEIEQQTNSYLSDVQMQPGIRPGTLNLSEKLIYDVNGEELSNGAKARVYGVFLHMPFQSKGVFTIEEVVKH